MNNPETVAPQQTVQTMLQRLVEKVERANIQHSGGPIDPEAWAALHQLANEARGLLAVQPFPNFQADRTRTLLALKDAGMTFGECINAFGIDRDTDPYGKAAQEKACEGEIEVDHTTVLSGSGDNGEYVMCWMWVSDAEAGMPAPPTCDLEDLTALGYNVGENPDQPGRYNWRKDDDASDISFDTQDQAIADASENALESYTLSRCDACGKVHSEEALTDIEQYSRRVRQDAPAPSGQCPKCGALCHLIKSE